MRCCDRNPAFFSTLAACCGTAYIAHGHHVAPALKAMGAEGGFEGLQPLPPYPYLGGGGTSCLRWTNTPFNRLGGEPLTSRKKKTQLGKEAKGMAGFVNWMCVVWFPPRGRSTGAVSSGQSGQTPRSIPWGGPLLTGRTNFYSFDQPEPPPPVGFRGGSAHQSGSQPRAILQSVRSPLVSSIVSPKPWGLGLHTFPDQQNYANLLHYRCMAPLLQVQVLSRPPPLSRPSSRGWGAPNTDPLVTPIIPTVKPTPDCGSAWPKNVSRRRGKLHPDPLPSHVLLLTYLKNSAHPSHSSCPPFSEAQVLGPVFFGLFKERVCSPLVSLQFLSVFAIFFCSRTSQLEEVELFHLVGKLRQVACPFSPPLANLGDRQAFFHLHDLWFEFKTGINFRKVTLRIVSKPLPPALTQPREGVRPRRRSSTSTPPSPPTTGSSRRPPSCTSTPPAGTNHAAASPVSLNYK